MKKHKEFLVNSKKACFLCLKVEATEDSKTSPWSISQLCRYLRLECKQVFNISVPLLQTAGNSVWEETDLQVSLCPDCHSVSTKFGKLFEELELIRLKVTASVKTIYEVMTNAEQDGRRVEQYRKLMTLSNPVELINTSISENLRKEMIQSCALKVESALPKVSMKKIDETKMKQGSFTSTHKTVPDTMEIPPNEDRLEEYNIRRNPTPVSLDNTRVFQDAPDPLGIAAMPSMAPERDTKKGRQSCVRKSNVCNKAVSKRHLKRRNAEERFECPNCPKRFREFRKLKMHQIGIHPIKIFAACRDPSGAVTDTQFETSIASVFLQNTKEDIKGNRTCNICDKQYNFQTDLKFHLVTVHFKMLCAQLMDKLGYTSEASISSPFPKHCHSGKNKNSKRKVPRKFSCPHCDKLFKQYNQHRVHLLSSHRYEVFAKYFDRDKTPVQVNFVLEYVLQKEFTSLGGNVWECRQCYRKLASLADVQDHLVVTHFNEVVIKLKNHLESGGILGEDRDPIVISQGQGQFFHASEEDEVVIKTEIKSEVILPD